MRISDCLPTSLVIPALAARNKDEALELLATRVAAHHPDVDHAALMTTLRERERQVSTALADGVAIPHARLRGLPGTLAALGRSEPGIACDSHDGKPTHLFLLLLVPQESPGSHLKLLANASRLLHDARCRARLMQAPDERAVLAVLRAEEDRATGASRAA